MTAQVRALLESARRVVLMGHAFPDGDSVGSALALAHALRGQGRTAHVLSREPVPVALCALPGAKTVVIGDAPPAGRPADVLVLVDCASPERSGRSAQDLARLAPRLVNLDHHVTNTGYGDAVWVEPDAAATGEVVASLLDVIGWPVTADIAACLYVALLTDTRGFRSPTTRPHTLRLAARLMDAGADGATLATQVLSTRRPEAVRLLARGLSRVCVRDDPPAVWLLLTAEDYAASGARPEEGEELVDFLQGVPGHPTGVFIRPESPGRWRVGLRSTGVPDVARVAAALGGGGHSGAAGVTLAGTPDEVTARVCAALSAMSGGGPS